jgi:L-rhamnose mutarotase
MFSIGFAMTLRPGAYPQYKHHHDHLWPEIARSMSDNHVNMAILRDGDRLIVHATAPTEADWDRSRQAPDLEKWIDQMKAYLETDADGNIKADALEHAFRFGQFAPE